MNKSLKMLIWPAFIIMVLAQIYVPAKMISHNENIINHGQEFKFLTRPIDPTDPLRGKYITLDFAENPIRVTNSEDWKRGETIYLGINNDAKGFAQVISSSKTKPNNSMDFIEAKASYRAGVDGNQIFINYPFDRYYMEESKAYDAEKIHRESGSNNRKTTYAVVAVKDGEAVLKDVMIDGIPIRELVKEFMEINQNGINKN